MWIAGWKKGQADGTAKDPLPEKKDCQKWENLLEGWGDTPAVAVVWIFVETIFRSVWKYAH